MLFRRYDSSGPYSFRIIDEELCEEESAGVVFGIKKEKLLFDSKVKYL